MKQSVGDNIYIYIYIYKHGVGKNDGIYDIIDDLLTLRDHIVIIVHDDIYASI